MNNRSLFKIHAAALAAMIFTFLTSALEAQFNNAHFINDQEVNIPVNFSPFGNSLEVSKFGDDGSSAVTDLSGVILWIDADGVTRRLPDTELAVPLYVTNSEVLVWSNRYTSEFQSYAERPVVALTLYRTNAAGDVFSTPLNLAGKEVLGTPQVTTSTGSLTIATSEAVEGGTFPVSDGNITVEVADTDKVLIKFYRVTFSGVPQLLETYTDEIPSNAFLSAGPEVEALGNGSDGSALYRYTSASIVINLPTVTEDQFDKFIWVNSFGVSRVVNLPAGLSKVVSITDNQLVLEETAGGGLSDFRRDEFTDQLSGPSPIVVAGSVLSAPNYTKVGDAKFFYTLDGNDIITHRLVGGTVNVERTAVNAPGVTAETVVSKINPIDGSAILSSPNQAGLIWLHDQGPNFVQIPNSELALPLFVTAEECVLWANAKATIPEGGTPEDVLVVHEELDVGGATTIRTELNDPAGVGNVEGTYVLNTPPYTLSTAFWLLNTAVKTAPDTALIRNYRLLETAPDQDDDSDGLTNAQEDLNGNGAFDAGVDVLITGQDETFYDDAGGVSDNGTFNGGDGTGPNLYAVNDVITLSDSSTVTVEAVNGDGDVTEFTVDSSNSTGAAAGDTLTQTGLVGTGTGTTFTLTLDANNLGVETNFENADTDGDGLSDRVETNSGIFVSTTDTGTDPNNIDTDGDGLLDAVETNSGQYVFYNFDDGDLVDDGNNENDPRNNTGTDPLTPNDTDEDGNLDGVETDIDNDEVLNGADAFPFDPLEDTDTDGDGIGNNADLDDDNDGALDEDDAFPLDPSKSNFTLIVSDSQHANSYLEQTREITVTSDTDWTWQTAEGEFQSGTPTTSNWLTGFLEDEAQTGNQTFTYKVEANETGQERIARIIFKTATGGVEAVLTVTQLPNSNTVLILSSALQANSYFEQTRTVDVISNTDWSWQSSDDWLTAITEPVDQSGDRKLVLDTNPLDPPLNTPFAYQVSENITGETRTGTLTFTSATGGITATLEVTQFSSEGINLSLSQGDRVVGAGVNGGLSNPENGQDEGDYVGNFAGGTLHGVGDIITLSDGTTVTVDAVGVGGVVTQFTVNSTTTDFSTLAGETLTQASTTGTGIDFSLTVQANNLANPLGLNVSSNTNWLWSSSEPWLTAANEAQQQNGDQPFTYAVAANETGAARTGTITFTSATGGLIATLDVTQLSVPGSSLSLSETELVTDFNAKLRTVDVFSDTTWLWQSSDPAWLTSAEDQQQSGTREAATDPPGAFEYAVSENTTGENRTATLTFTTEDGSVIAILEVTQLSGDGQTLSLGESERVVSSAADTTRILDVFASDAWLWESDASWLAATSEPQAQSGDRVADLGPPVNTPFAYEVAANDTGAQRVGVLTFRSATGGLVETLTVTQLSAPGSTLSLSESVRLTDFSAKTVVGANVLTVDVISDPTTTWLWESDALWLTSPENQENTDSLSGFEYEVTENTTDETRTGTLTFTTQDLSVTLTLIVTQLSGGDETLGLDVNEVAYRSFEDLTGTVDVTSNATWSWTSNAAWLSSAEDQQQTGNNAAFGYEVAANDTGAERVGTITFTTETGLLVETLTVTQQARLSLSESELVTDFTARPVAPATLDFEVTADTTWVWESDAAWLTSGGESQGTGAQTPLIGPATTFSYDIAENTTGQTRVGSFTFTSSDNNTTVSFTVTQLSGGDETLGLDVNEVAYRSFEDLTGTVDVTSNATWSWTSNAAWLSSAEDQQQTGNNAAFGYEVAANDTGAERVGTITFTTETGLLVETLTVTQQARLSLSESELVTDFTARPVAPATLDFEVTADTTWVWESDAAWLTSGGESQGTGAQTPLIGPATTFSYDIAENTTGQTRVGSFTFTSSDNNTTVSFTVTQLSGGDETLGLDVNEVAYRSFEDLTGTVDVTSNATWSWTSNAAWLSSAEDQQQTGNNAAFGYEVAANDTGAERVGTITFTTETGLLVETLTVTQQARLSLSESELVTDFTARPVAPATLDFEVTADTTWVWESDAAWLTSGGESQGTGAQTPLIGPATTFSYDIAENTTGQTRVGSFTFTSSDNNTTVSFTVTQLSGGDETLGLDVNEVAYRSFEDLTGTVDVTSNATWSWTSNAAWLSSAEDQQQTGNNAAFGYEVAANDTGAERVGTITFTTETGLLVETLTVTQQARLSLSESELVTDFTARPVAPATLDFEVTADTTWVWESDAAWLTSGGESQGTGAQTPLIGPATTFSYDIAENTTGQTRVGSFTFTSSDNNTTVSFTVTQLSGGDETLGLDVNEVAYRSFEDLTGTVDVTSNATWSWTSNAAWLSSAEDQQQTGNNAAFGYEVAANDTGAERVGTITFTTETGLLVETLTVTQQARLSLSESELVTDFTARPVAPATLDFEVTADTTWVWESDAAWLTSGGESQGTGAQTPLIGPATTFSYDIAENTTGQTRVGSFTFTSSDNNTTVSFTVTQLSGGDETLGLDVNEVAYRSFEDLTGTVDVTSNATWSWTSNAAWLSSAEDQQQTGNNAAFGYEVAANDTGAERVGTITFTTETGLLVETLTVTQQARLSLSESELVTDFTARPVAPATLDFEVTADTTWVWESDAAWLTSGGESQGTGAQTPLIGPATTFSYDIAENTTGQTRVGSFTFTSSDNNTTVSFTVTQLSGGDETLGLDVNEVAYRSFEDLTGTVDVTSNATWSWTSNAAWLSSAEDQQQTGNNAAFGYEVAANDTGAERVGTITFTTETGLLVETLTVTQQARLSLSESELVTDFTARPVAPATLDFEVTADTTWVWESDAAWLTSGGESQGTGAQTPLIGPATTFSYDIAENTTGQTRVGSFTFTSSDNNTTVSFTVTQLSGGDETLGLDVNEVAYRSFEDLTGTVDVTSNATWSWTSNAAWLSSAEDQQQTGNNAAFGYEVAANDTGAERVGTITFTTETGLLVETLTVTQQARLSLSESELVTDFTARPVAPATLDFEVTADTTWVWESDAAWLTSGGESQGTGAQTPLIGPATTFSYDIAENTTGQTRVGSFTFTSSDNNTTVSFTVTQLSGGDETLGLDVNEVAYRSFEDLTGTVDVTSNATWSWTSNAAWLSSAEDQQQTGNNAAFGYEVAANDTGAERVGTITFTTETGLLVETLTVTQQARLSLSESELVTDFTARPVAPATLDFEVTADTTWVWESDAAWLTSGGESQGTGAQTPLIGPATTFSYDIAENTTGQTRVGSFTFTSSDNNTTVSFTVTQLSGTDETLAISETPRFSDFTNKELTVDVSSNTKWLWSSDSGWLTSLEEPTVDGNVAGFKYNLALNDTGVDRTGTITFITESGRLVQTLTVTQLSNTGDFLILSDRLQASDFTAKTVVGNNARSVEVFSSLDVIWESSEDWLTSPAEATLTANLSGQTTFTYELNENTTGQTREARITFRTNTGDITETLRVIQGGDAGDYLIASETQVTTDFNDKSISVDVFSGTEWTWEVNAEAREWLSSEEDRTQNDDKEPFVFSVATNNTEASREGTITFSSTTGNLEHVLTITQLSGSDFYLNLSQTSATYSFEATGSKTVVVDSNAQWTWRSTEGWLTSTTEPTVDGNGTFNFDYSLVENTGGEPREARLQFFSTDGRLTAELVITQLANTGSVLTLSEINHANSYLATPDGSPREFEVFSNRTWLWEVKYNQPDNRDWLIVTEPLEQTGDQTFSYKVAENFDDEGRDADIIFTTINGDVSISINVRQLAGPGANGLNVSPSALPVSPEGGEQVVKILSDRDWGYVINDSWLTSDEDISQSDSQDFTFNVAENRNGIARVGTVTFTTAAGDLTETLQITQFATEDDDRDGLTNLEETNPFFVIKGSFTWEQARLDAIRRGGTLAVIEDEDEHKKMTDVLDSFDSPLWIGASRAANPASNFVWASPSAGQTWIQPSPAFNIPLSITKWDVNQPNVPYGEAGIALMPGRLTLDPPIELEYKWSDYNKYDPLGGYILELHATEPLNPFTVNARVKDGELWIDSDDDGLLGITEVTLGTDPETDDTDRDGLTDGEEYNRFDIISGGFTWQQAFSDAVELGGRLAVIQTDDKLARVMSSIDASFGEGVWIGGFNESLPFIYDDFDWFVDPDADPLVKEELLYGNWAEGQPSGFFGPTAIKMNIDFEWDAVNPDETLGYILESESTEPLNPDSDDDDLNDGLEVKVYGTDPNVKDSDGDGLWDGNEVKLGSNPLLKDTDGDGLDDGAEDKNNDGVIDPNSGETDPTNSDTDGDNLNDGDEVTFGSNPNDPNDPVVGGTKRIGFYELEFLSDADVSIPQPLTFTPYGNFFSTSKFSDDGSRVYWENSGQLVWVDAQDNVKILDEESEDAVAVYVTNNELIVWGNKFAEGANPVDVTLYRTNTLGELTSSKLPILGDHVVETAQMGVSSSSIIILTAQVGGGSSTTEPNTVTEYTEITTRAYRVTYNGQVQLIGTHIGAGVITPSQSDPNSEPSIEILAQASDGSVLFSYYRDQTLGGGVDSMIWLNPNGDYQTGGFSQGAFREIARVNSDPQGERVGRMGRVIYLSAKRLVYEEDIEDAQGNRLNSVVYDWRRDLTNDKLIPPGTGSFGDPNERIYEIKGNVIGFTDYSKWGENKYFYTFGGDYTFSPSGSIISSGDNIVRTYKLSEFDDSVELVRTAILPTDLSAGARVHSLDTKNGAAIIKDQDQENLIWLHDGLGKDGDSFTIIDNSSRANSLYVTNDECVLWENAYDALPENGELQKSILVNYQRVVSPIPDIVRNEVVDIEGDPVEGTNILDVPQFTPDFDYWFVNTAGKVDSNSAKLRRYRLTSSFNFEDDFDGDGVENGDEVINQTDPRNPDTDGDGLSDGDEITYETDPNNPDSDGDGLGDGDEVVLGTDPMKNNYESDTNVDLSAIPNKGTFIGLLQKQGDNLPIGRISIKIKKDKKGLPYFSGRIAGTTKYSSSSFKGKFDLTAKYEGELYNSNGLLSVANMAFILDGAGRLSLGGVLTSPNGEQETFRLVRGYYNKLRKATQFLNTSRYTYLAESLTTNLLNIPAGDAVGYGSISSYGKVTIKGWSNAGYKYTYKGYLQNGNQIGLPGDIDFALGNYGTIPFYARTYGESKKRSLRKSEWMLGTISYNMSDVVESIDGDLRYVKPVSNSLYYPAGFDEDILMQGSRYNRAGYAAVPANGFGVFANNALGLFDGKLPDNSEFNSYIFTWQSKKGRMRTPKNFTVYKKGTFRNKHGFFTSKVIDYVSGKRASIRGVVMQNKDFISGSASYAGGGVTLKHTIIPNDTGEYAPNASISPTSKNFDTILGKSPGGSYNVKITISPNSTVQNWVVSIPVSWVSANVTSGSGSGTITFTVSENRTLYDREAVIKIGGLKHRITQERRTSD